MGSPAPVDVHALPQDLTGPGLALIFVVEEEAAVLLVPAGSQFLPDWCVKPDSTGRSKLMTLAQELAWLVFPEGFTPADSHVGYVSDLGAAMIRGGVADGAVGLCWDLCRADGNSIKAQLIWPATKPADVLDVDASQGPSAVPPVTEPKPVPSPVPSPAMAGTKAASPRVSAPPTATLAHLPGYSRSLLRIKVPVVVTLAQKKQGLGRTLELGPGSIIQFDKSCEEVLELDVGGHPVAMGEAVKVGDKFGLRVTSMILPGERFKRVEPGADKQARGFRR